jgi:alpha-glucosidase
MKVPIKNRGLQMAKVQILGSAAAEGIPAMRPDFWNEVDYSASRDEYAYFFGDDMYVCPVIEKDVTERTVYLPEGDWIGFWDKERYTGKKRINVRAPLGKTPVFYRADSSFRDVFRKAMEDNR